MEYDLSQRIPYDPGYTDYPPRFKYRAGESFGSKQDKTLLELAVMGRETLHMSDRAYDTYEIKNPCMREIDCVTSRFYPDKEQYKHSLPGFEGFVPRNHGRYRQFYRVEASQNLQNTEKQHLQDQIVLNSLKNRMARVKPPYKLKKRLDVDEDSDFTFPIHMVRPELCATITTLFIKPPYLPPPPNSPYEFFSRKVPPEYDGYEPYVFPNYSKGHAEIIPSELSEFTNNYQYRRSAQWVPLNVTGAPCLGGGTDGFPIYHRSLGMTGSYAGHIPGSRLRVGKNLFSDTRDAKRWLRGDFANRCN